MPKSLDEAEARNADGLTFEISDSFEYPESP